MFISLKTNYEFDGNIIYRLFQDIIWEPTNEKIDQIIEKSRNDKTYKIIGSIENNELIGIIIYKVKDNKNIIEYFGIEKGYRRKGMGSKLINEIIKNTTVDYIEAETDEDAVEFYRKYGFTITSLGAKYQERERYKCEYRINSKHDMSYWESLEKLIKENGITIDRKKGSRHPRYSDLIYVVDYGYINNTKSMDNNEIDIYKGSGNSNGINGIFCTIDSLKKDSEIKVVINCDKKEIEAINDQLNNSEYMKAIYFDKKTRNVLALLPSDIRQT